MRWQKRAIPWDGVHLDLRAGDAQRPEYTKLSPNQVVPTPIRERGGCIALNALALATHRFNVQWHSPLVATPQICQTLGFGGDG
jgi:hypothetical protein